LKEKEEKLRRSCCWWTKCFGIVVAEVLLVQQDGLLALPKQKSKEEVVCLKRQFCSLLAVSLQRFHHHHHHHLHTVAVADIFAIGKRDTETDREELGGVERGVLF
jgi:hypothetical protein